MLFSNIVANWRKSCNFSDIVGSKIAILYFQQHRGFVRSVFDFFCGTRM